MPRRLLLPLVVAVAAARRVGDGFGTNIHWTHENAAGEAEMLARAFKIARMDFEWQGIESTCGSYDFSQYDALLSTLEAVRVRSYWILDYGNPCFPPTPGSPAKSCNTAECIAAFGRFALAAAAHFHGHGIIWETVNEPNGMGGDNATDLAALAASAAVALRPYGELLVGPATAGMDFPYIEKNLYVATPAHSGASTRHAPTHSHSAAGSLLSYTNVSVHPYRSGPPESVLADWVTLRGLVERYAPAGKATMPLIDGEWGYTSAIPPCNYGNKVSELTQGKYLVRMWLTNLIAGVETSIAYDWRDDGVNATNCEDNFGSVRAPATGNATQPFTPKPAFLAALTAQTGIGSASSFAGVVFPSKLPAGVVADDVFILSFAGYSRPGGGGSPVAFAVWTNATTGLPTPPISFPVTGAAPDACFRAVNVLGAALAPVCAKGGIVSLAFDDGPTYLL